MLLLMERFFASPSLFCVSIYFSVRFAKFAQVFCFPLSSVCFIGGGEADARAGVSGAEKSV